MDWPRIDRCLVRFDAGSLALMLAAAGDSPGAGHRQPNLILLWLRCVAAPPTGAIIASGSDLPRLLPQHEALPQLRILEGCWSADPRLVVRFPVTGQRFRVHPGPWSNPVQALRPVTATAEAIDDFVLERHGFRLTDLLEVALRYSDHWMDFLSDAWPTDGLALDRGNPPTRETADRAQRRRSRNDIYPQGKPELTLDRAAAL